MPSKPSPDTVIDPLDFVSLNYYWKRRKGAVLVARRADGSLLRLQGVSEDEQKCVAAAMKEIDSRIDRLRDRLKK